MASKKPLPASAAKKDQPARGKRKNMSRAELLEIQDKRMRRIWSIVLFAVGILFVFIALMKGDEGNLWNVLHNALFAMFSWGGFFIGPLLIFVAVLGASNKAAVVISNKVWQMAIVIVLICATIEIFHGETALQFASQETIAQLAAADQAKAQEIQSLGAIDQIVKLATDGMVLEGGGLISAILAWPLVALMGVQGAQITISLVLFVFAMLVTGLTLVDLFRAFSKPVRSLNKRYLENRERHREEQARFAVDVPLGPDEEELPQHPVQTQRPQKDEEVEGLFRRSSKPRAGDKARAAKDKLFGEQTPPPVEAAATATAEADPEPVPLEPELDDEPVEHPDMGTSAERLLLDSLVNNVVSGRQKPSLKPEPVEPLEIPATDEAPAEEYVRPTIGLLDRPAETNEEDITEELKTNAARLVDTLASFGVQTRIVDISRGPSVTRYELQPSAGVKISRITGLSDDIALNLASAGVRIEAPIPNKAAVGIEVPNKIVSIVNISEILESPSFVNARSKLTVALGKDIEGKVVVADVAKMPHVLIAGATGSGKSICINSILISLLYKSTPDEVRLLLVDPKVVELGVYNGIPHLLIPVVTDPRKAAGALAWAVGEMLNRYKLFADNAVRDLNGYNALATTRGDMNLLPQIVIVIDELADLMMAAPNDVESSICRLAQMARAAGMHLIIATQRPSVDVITGIIKANIPSRIAFSVASQVDSRTIIDQAGADKLLGRGDMLFFPVGASKPTRVQGCYVSDREVERVISYIKSQGVCEYDQQVIEDIENQAVAENNGKNASSGDSGEAEDEMLKAAMECVIEAGQASTSLLQRRLKVGYARAGRLIDEMEQRGIVGPFEGSKPRQVLMTRQQFLEMSMNQPEPEA